jgi:hypothetical protein
MDGGSTDGGSTDASDAATVLHFSKVWTDIMESTDGGPSGQCANCHFAPVDGGPAAHGGFTIGKLDLSSADAGYVNLVNVPAQGTSAPETDGGLACDLLADAGDAGSIRVVPDKAAESLLYLKVNGWLDGGSTPCGTPMPFTGPLPDGGQAAAVAEIKAWINGGALP